MFGGRYILEYLLDFSLGIDQVNGAVNPVMFPAKGINKNSTSRCLYLSLAGVIFSPPDAFAQGGVGMQGKLHPGWRVSLRQVLIAESPEGGGVGCAVAG